MRLDRKRIQPRGGITSGHRSLWGHCVIVEDTVVADGIAAAFYLFMRATAIPTARP